MEDIEEEGASSRMESLLAGVGDNDWGIMMPKLDECNFSNRESAKKLWRIWKEAGLREAERGDELSGITRAIEIVWGNALERAEGQVAGLRKMLEETLKEVREVQVQLGVEEAKGGSLGGSGEVLKGNSVREKYDAAKELLGLWNRRKEEREAEFQRLMEDLGRMRTRLGFERGNVDQMVFSAGAMSQAKDELEKLHANRQRREMDLEAVLSQLRKLCVELGENDVEFAERAHPTLRYYREALPGKFHAPVRWTSQQNTEIRSDLSAKDIEIDLTDSTFDALEKTIEETERLKTVREQQAAELSQVLNNLWKVLGIDLSEVDRGIHTRLLEGPTRLHSKSIDKCMNEVNRLEKAKAARLQILIEERIVELKELHESTHLEMPDLSPLLPAEGGDGQVASRGLVSDALGKLIRMVEHVSELAEKRAGIISLIMNLEGCKSEIGWLVAYEKDEGRYKGRDSNRNLQKALKVGKLRDKMPATIDRIRDAIEDWEESENCPFMFEGEEYKEVLNSFAEKIECSMASRRTRSTKAGELRAKGHSPSSSQGLNSRIPRLSVTQRGMGMGSQVFVPEELHNTGRNAKSLHLSYRIRTTPRTPRSSARNPPCTKRNGSIHHRSSQEKSNRHGRSSSEKANDRSSAMDVSYMLDDITNDPPSYDEMIAGDWDGVQRSPRKSESDVYGTSGDWKCNLGKQRVYCFDQDQNS